MGQSLSTSVLKGLVTQLSILAPRYHRRRRGKVIVVLIQLLKCDRCDGVNNGNVTGNGLHFGRRGLELKQPGRRLSSGYRFRT